MVGGKTSRSVPGSRLWQGLSDPSHGFWRDRGHSGSDPPLCLESLGYRLLSPSRHTARNSAQAAPGTSEPAAKAVPPNPAVPLNSQPGLAGTLQLIRPPRPGKPDGLRQPQRSTRPCAEWLRSALLRNDVGLVRHARKCMPRDRPCETVVGKTE
jgi:hypothetical protein